MIKNKSAYLWAKRNPEKIRAKARRWAAKYPDKVRNRSLKIKYGITLNEYNIIFEEQEGRCAICQRHQQEFKKRLFVDHNHKTNMVRGLLCSFCNSRLFVLEDKDYCAKASIYLSTFAI